MKHLDPDEIDLDETAGHPHLAECPTCREVYDSQLVVRRLLAAAPDPGPVPDDLVARIDAALAAASLDPAGAADPRTGAPAAPGTVGTTVTPLRPPAPERRGGLPGLPGRRWLAVAAAAAVVLGGGAVLAQHLPSSDVSSAASSASGGASRAAGKGADEVASTPVLATGTTYTAAGLPVQVSALVKRARAQGAPAPSGPARGLADVTALRGCLQAIGANGAAVAVDLARFNGADAALVVLPGDPGSLEVWVVARDCRPGADGVRFFATVPEPR